MKKAIITGATGTIGTALIEELLFENYHVLVLLNPDSTRNHIIPNNSSIKKIYCSLDQLKHLENTENETYDVFYHLAWQGAAGPGRNDMYLQTSNIQYSLDAVNTAHRFGCKKFIGTGSQAEYGRFDSLLTPETPVFPENGYGYAKLCAGLMTKDLAHLKGIEHIWIRILSVFGPNDSPNTMIMSTIKKLISGISPELTAGDQIWDFLYSKDAAKALSALGEHGSDGKTYVLGSGEKHLLKEYVLKIRDLISPSTNICFGKIPYTEKQVMHLCADISDITTDTGWTPSTTFSNGIKELLKTDFNF